jgi:hypothetical protein
MAPPSSGSGFGFLERDAQLDTIDLTLSSPEPEQRPRLPPQQQTLPSYFKTEPWSESSHSRIIKSERRASVRAPRPHGSQSHARRIHPQHLANIVRSTDYQVVEAVLLDLCLRSPALSGAVARGLAAHSTFAQSIIKRHHPNPQGSGSRPPARDNRSESQDARDRMRQRLAARNAVSGSSLSQTPSTVASAQSARSAGSQDARSTGPQTARFAGSQRSRPTGSLSAPRMKREHQPDMGESDSDLDQYIPRDFPVNSQQATPTRLPLREMSSAHSTSRTSLPFSLFQPPINSQTKRAPEPKAAKPCIQCHEKIEEEDEDGLCFYHPGPPRNVNGKMMCGSCNKAVDQPGCGFGTHVTRADTEIDALKRYSSNRSQSPSKRPRMT